MKPRSLTFFSLLLAAGCTASAQTPESTKSLEEEFLALINTPITVASKKAESQNAAPGIVSVITKAEIEGFAAQNLGQILNRVVGMNMLSPDVFRDQSVIIRGQESTPYNNHVLVLLNGRPMRDPATGGLNAPIWAAFPLELVERIEIIRGPGSVLYGSCAFSGLVNIITQKRDKEGFGGHLALRGGADSGFGQHANMTFKHDDLTGIVGISQYSDNGPAYSFVDYNGVNGRHHFQRHTLNATAHLEYKGLALNLSHGYFDPYTLNASEEKWDQDNYQRHALTHLDLGYNVDLNKMVNIGANITYNKTNWDTEPKSNPVKNNAEATLFEPFCRIAPLDNLNILLGAGYEKAECNKGNKDVARMILKEQTQKSHFFFTQVDYRIQAVKLIGGIQYNKIEKVNGNISPRFGAIWDITPEFGVKALYNSAFRKGYFHETGFSVVIPGLGDLFLGNPELKPELINTTELQAFYQGKSAQASITYYKSKMKDIIGRVNLNAGIPGPPSFKYFNRGESDFYGFEFDGRLSLSQNLMLTANASHQRNEKDGVKGTSLHAENMIKLGMLYAADRWSLGIADAWFDKPYSTQLMNPGSQMVNPEPEAYRLISAKFMWKFIDSPAGKVKVAVEADNILGKDVRYPDYPNKAVNSLIPLHSGRTYQGTLSYTF